MQEVSCAQLGYTMYECDTCHTMDIQHIQERLEHAYGDLEYPTVTCTEGGYIKQTCALCQHSIELQYVRAKGHTVTKVATCTEGVYCEDCKELVTPATGHNWSEWTTVVEPTETATGLRRRNCPKCGTVEEAKIAYTGSIQKLNFESYEDILNFLVKDVLNMENGKITLNVESSEYMGADADMQIDFTVSKAGESYEMLIDYNYVEEDGTYKQLAQLLYRNGIAIALRGKDALGDKDIATLTGDVFGYYFGMPFEAYGEYWTLIFDTFAPVYEPVLEEMGPLFDVMDVLLADVIDDADLYTPGELANAFLKIKNTYAYWAYKMDYMTSLSYDNTIEVVTRQDILDTLSYFMTVTEDATGKHYTWDASKLMDSIDAVLTWLEENEETTMDEVIWMLIGEQVTAKFPEIESFDDLIAALTEALPGTTPIQDVIDDMIAFIDDKKEGATASLYAMVDSIALIFMAGGEFDSEEFLLSFGEEGTLNDLVAMCFGEEEATVEMLFQMVDQMMKGQTVGDMMIPYYLIRAEKTISELLPTVRETFDRILLDVDLAFTLDQSGKLVSLTNSNEGKYVIGETGNQQTVELMKITMSITCNDSIKVQIPAALQSVADDKVTATFNEAGQLVVKVPTGYDLDFRLRSSGLYPSMDYVLEKNADMSGEMGFDVYVVKPQFASGNNGYTNVYHLYEVNGVYYQSIGFGGGSKYSYTKICTISELQSNIASLVQREKHGEQFYIDMDGEEGIAYEAEMLGSYYWFVELNGELYLKKDSRHSYSDYDTYTESKWDPVQFQYVRKEYVRFYGDYTLVALEDIFSDVQVSSMYSYSTAPIDGVKRDLWNVYLALDIETWGTDTLEATCYIDSNDNLVLCQEVYQSDHKIYLYPLDAAPAGKLVNRYEVRSENFYYSSTQTKVEDTIYQVEIESAVTVVNPVTCYAKMANGMYVNVEYLVSNPAIRNITDTVTLSDGTQMYVIGERNMSGRFGDSEYDSYFFGYVKVLDGAYTEAIAYCAGGQVIGERYRYATDTYSNMYGFDVSYYMTKMDDTTYVFAAELFTFLQDMCEDAGDMYAIVVDGDKQIGDDYYTLYAYATMYMEPLNSISLGRGESADINLNWDEMFRGISTTPSFRIMQENKDTVSIYFDMGSQIEVYEYQMNNRYPANSYMVRDDAKSNEYGLEIYRYSFPYLQNETTYYYVLKDGKYYGYWYDDVYDLTLSNNLTDLFKDNWSLEDIYYYYDLRDPAITGGTDLRVYKAILCFNNTYEGYIPVYVTVKNGKLMALTGAVEMGDSVLKFEDLKPFSAYVQMLTSSAQEVSGRDSYKDGNFRYAGDSKLYQVTYTYVELTETDATGEIKTHTLRVQIFEQNGVKKYVKEAKYLGYYMNIEDQPATLPAYDRMTQKTELFFNGTFTIAALTKIREHLDYAVKLAGKFYDLDTYVHYYGPRLTEAEFKEAMSTIEWFYFIYDDNGDRVFYNKLEDDYDKWDNHYGILSEPVDTATANALIDVGKVNDLGICDKDGNWIYEVSAYIPKDWELVSEPQGDGTVFYHHKGMTKGYLKDQDGMYVRASKIVAGDGSTYILCYTELVSVDDKYLQELGAFKNEIVFNQNGTIVTISKDLITWIEQNGLENYFTVTFRSYDKYYGDRYTVTLTYYDLVAWFKLAEAGDLVPGEVGDPTLPTESDWW